MQIIPLQAVPRQRFTITLDNVRFDITLQTIGGCMYSSILANGAVITSGVKCMPGFQLMPARWMEGTAGNFAFATPNGELPNYANFQTTHILYYASASELATMRGGHASI